VGVPACFLFFVGLSLYSNLWWLILAFFFFFFGSTFIVLLIRPRKGGESS